jgi:hypothetical protein
MRGWIFANPSCAIEIFAIPRNATKSAENNKFDFIVLYLSAFAHNLRPEIKTGV